MSDAAVDAAADGAAEAMETVATTTTTLATSALATISTYVSAHVAATRDEAARFCNDVTEKALASLEPVHARWTRRYMAVVEKFRDKD